MIEPGLPVHNDISRATLRSLVDAGERAALLALPAMRRIFSA